MEYKADAKECELCHPEGICCYCKNIPCYELEKENKELKNEYWKLEQGNDFLAEKNSKLKGCLTEIKEIAEKGHKEKGNLMRTWWFKDILQKISEVENEK